jgi:hypothetical protein
MFSIFLDIIVPVKMMELELVLNKLIVVHLRDRALHSTYEVRSMQ